MGVVVGLKTGPANFFFFYHALNPSLRSVYLAKLRQRFLTFFNVFESRITGENCTTGDPSNYVKSRAFSADYRTRNSSTKKRRFLPLSAKFFRDPPSAGYIFHYIFEL